MANALDKLEVQLQHNHAEFSTWEEIEYEMSYMMDQHVLFDETLAEFKNRIELEAEQKMNKHGVNTTAIKNKIKS